MGRGRLGDNALSPARHATLTGAVQSAFDDLPSGSRVLAAVSGGADSVALLHLLHAALPELGLGLEVVHLDHQLRPDSEADRDFVADLAGRLGLRLHAERRDVRALADERGLGLEEAARSARYRLFDEVAAATAAAAVALGHTLDDRAETLLLHLVRGAAGGGLAGMRARRGILYRRPLLGFRRRELRDLLDQLGEPFREDPSNRDPRFRRNFVRHQVVPLLESRNPRVVEALARAATRLEEDDAVLTELAGQATFPLDAAELAGRPPALARRIAIAALRDACGHHPNLGHEHVDAVLALARGERGGLATDLPGGLRLARRAGQVVLDPPPGAGESGLSCRGGVKGEPGERR